MCASLGRAAWGGSNPAKQGQRKPTGTSQCWNWLDPCMQFLKSAKEKSDYYHIMLVEAQGEGTLYQLKDHERWRELQNSSVSYVWTLTTNVSFHVLILYFIAV